MPSKCSVTQEHTACEKSVVPSVVAPKPSSVSASMFTPREGAKFDQNEYELTDAYGTLKQKKVEATRCCGK